jgi:uncharacterized protein (TIGR03545 family)
MKNIIRWPGLIGFVVTISIIVIFWMLFAGSIIKSAVESLGSDAVGAKVEVDSINLQLSPLGVSINKLQIADADEPMQNTLQFDHAVAELELLPLLLGKGIVKELSITGMAFEQPRTTSGALVKEPKKETNTSVNASSEKTNETETNLLDNVTVPSANEILARETLQTEVQGNAFKELIETDKARLAAAINNAPNEKDFDAYKKSFYEMTSGKFSSLDDFKKKQKAFNEMKENIDTDRIALNDAIRISKESKTNIEKQWGKLRQSPTQDYNRVINKYQLNATGASNISQLIFGGESSVWVDKSLYWYQKVKPLLESSEDESKEEDTIVPQGRFVHFKSNNPLPDFLIKKTRAQVSFDQGNVATSVYNITHQPRILNKPTVVEINGSGLKDIESIKANIIIDARNKNSTSTFELTVKDYSVKKWDLGYEGLALDKALIQINANGAIQNNQLLAEATGQFNQSVFSGSGSNGFAKELQKTMKKITSFNVKGNAEGDIFAPKIGISSNLDDAISTAFNQRLNEKKVAFEKSLKKQLNEKLLDYSGDYKSQIEALNLTGNNLESTQRSLEGLSKKKLSSWQEQQKAEAKKKAKKKQKKLENKLKDQLKGLKF